jgi:hypothetical protein
MDEPELTDRDREELAQLDDRLQLIRDAVRGVVRGYQTGLLVYGEGGMGKSHTVLNTLAGLQTLYTLHNSRLTGKGLVNALQANPAGIHLVEDAETLLDDKRAWGVLRSALWSQSAEKPPPREITWAAHQTDIRFTFTGGIIILSNTNLAESDPELRALRSRIKVLGLNPTTEQVIALMKDICMKGHAYGGSQLSPAECWEVAGYIIRRSEELGRRPDLRSLITGFNDYLQAQHGESESTWQALVDSQMTGPAVYRGRREAKQEESRIAQQIHQLPLPIAEKVRRWKEKTNLGRAAYYKALKRLKAA